MKEIRLGNSGKVALIDDEDWASVSRYKWYVRRNPLGGYTDYVQANLPMIDGKRPGTISLHRFLLNPGRGIDVDHANGDGLDNRRANLRRCTRSQNLANQKRRARLDSGDRFVGVRKTRSGTFQAHIGFGGRWISLGTFGTDEEAARARDEAAIEFYGSFARLNFPEVGPCA